MELEGTAAGWLEIQSGLGHRVYDLADLRIARLVPMVPQVPLAEVVGFGDMLPLATHVAEQADAFSADRNLFYADEKGGRFVFSDELLEWGVRYRLLSAEEVTPPSDLGSVLKWKPEGKFGCWISYEMALPSAFVASKPHLPASISAFLGHRIRGVRPRLYVVDPLPHHVDIDGTYVYPKPPESLLLRRSGIGAIAVTASGGAATVSVTDQGDEWVRLEGLSTGKPEFTVAVDGFEQAIVRVENCELFRPCGIAVSTGELTWDLCTDAPLPDLDLMRREVRIDCGSARIAAHIARLNDEWFLEQSKLSSPSGSPKNLNAGSFGELRAIVATSPHELAKEPGETASVPQVPASAARRWIERLVVRSFGAEGASRVMRYFADPSPANYYRLGPIGRSRLMAYIRATQDQARQEHTEGD